eukprot:3300159-Rhodomonas_salina.1
MSCDRVIRPMTPAFCLCAHTDAHECTRVHTHARAQLRTRVCRAHTVTLQPLCPSLSPSLPLSLPLSLPFFPLSLPPSPPSFSPSSPRCCALSGGVGREGARMGPRVRWPRRTPTRSP